MSDLLPADLSPHGLAFLLATAFIAALARGFSGFGAALIFLPLAATRQAFSAWLIGRAAHAW